MSTLWGTTLWDYCGTTVSSHRDLDLATLRLDFLGAYSLGDYWGTSVSSHRFWICYWGITVSSHRFWKFLEGVAALKNFLRDLAP